MGGAGRFLALVVFMCTALTFGWGLLRVQDPAHGAP